MLFGSVALGQSVATAGLGAEDREHVTLDRVGARLREGNGDACDYYTIFGDLIRDLTRSLGTRRYGVTRCVAP